MGNRNPKRRIARRTKHEPCEAFVEWIDASGLKIPDVAKLLGLSEPGVFNLRNGNRKPSLLLAARIAEKTGGKVPIEAWAK